MRLGIFALLMAAHGSAFSQGLPAHNPDEAIIKMHEVARCLAGAEPVLLSDALAAVPGSDLESDRVSKLREDGGDCLAFVMPRGRPWDMAAISFKPALVRGPFAEAMLKRFEKMPVARRRSLTRPFDLAEAAAASEVSDRTRTSLVVMDFADCVYRNAPADVASLFATKPASQAEREAVNRLSPQLGPCLSAGAKFEINSYLLRGALAEAAYRYAVTTAISATALGQNQHA